MSVITPAPCRLSGSADSSARYLYSKTPYAERVICTLRRECIDHVVILGETHLRRIVRRYVNYDHGARTHLALDKDTPGDSKTGQPGF